MYFFLHISHFDKSPVQSIWLVSLNCLFYPFVLKFFVAGVTICAVGFFFSNLIELKQIISITHSGKGSHSLIYYNFFKMKKEADLNKDGEKLRCQLNCCPYVDLRYVPLFVTHTRAGNFQDFLRNVSVNESHAFSIVSVTVFVCTVVNQGRFARAHYYL